MIFFWLHPYDYDPQWLIFFRGVGTVGTPSEIIDAPDWANSNDLIDFVGLLAPIDTMWILNNKKMMSRTSQSFAVMGI